MTKMDMAYFPTVAGSMTSEDGQTFMLHVMRQTGGDLLLGFSARTSAAATDRRLRAFGP